MEFLFVLKLTTILHDVQTNFKITLEFLQKLLPYFVVVNVVIANVVVANVINPLKIKIVVRKEKKSKT